MTLENHIEFWRREMAPKIPEDKFRKDHLYNIRHAHGKEGGRKDYTPMNCLTIISKVPGNVGLGLRKAWSVVAVSELCLNCVWQGRGRGGLPCTPTDCHRSRGPRHVKGAVRQAGPCRL